MTKLWGVLRLAMALSLIVLAAVSVLVTSLIPLRIRGIPLPAWSVTWVVRLLCFVYRVRVTCTDPEKIRSHSGLIFPNHTSVLDILVLYYCAPMRFLAAHDVGDRPLIGWTARKTGTLFVRRDNPRSRAAARTQVADAVSEKGVPPVVLFPEGRLGPGNTLFPFRHGAFGIAIEREIPYLVCAIRYSPLDLVLWRAAAQGEGMWSSIWRMVQYWGVVEAEVIPLDIVLPRSDDSSKELANQARQQIANALGLPLEEDVPA